MTIYNFEHYYSATMPSNTGTALAAMFTAMNPGPYTVGGLAFIPQLVYANVALSPTAFVVPDQCNIIGSGGGGSTGPTGTPYYHFIIDYTNGSLFLGCTGDYTSGGKYFRGLAFRGINPQSVSDTCIYADTANCRAVNCTFTDIPLAFNAQGDGCSLEQCTINFDKFHGTPSVPVKAVILAGAQCAISGPGELQQQPRAMDGPANCTCVSIEGAKQTVIAETHFVDWNIGIDFEFAAGAIDTDIRNCEIQCAQSALNIMLPSGATTATSGVKVTSCMLAKSNDSSTDDTAGHAVVIINPQGANNSLLNDITLLDCTVFTMGPSSIYGQHGLNIMGGSNIKIIGGTYSNNSSNGGAGIAITGPCGDVQIIGANLQPIYPWAGTIEMGSSLNNQQYGLLVSGGPTGTIYVSNCDLTGYTGTGMYPQQAVLVTGTAPHELLISNCPGYNDKNSQISTIAPLGSTYAADASTLGGTSINYYGPSVFIFSSPGTVNLSVFGQTITTSFGIIYLPSPYDSFNFITTGPTMFLWIGK